MIILLFLPLSVFSLLFLNISNFVYGDVADFFLFYCILLLELYFSFYLWLTFILKIFLSV